MNSKQKLVPYGIDFLQKSVQQARKEVLPEFKGNFCVGNFVRTEFGQRFDYVITDPECASDEDMVYFYDKCVRMLRKNGMLIFFIQPDAFKRIKKRPRTLHLLKTKKLKWIKYRNMVCCYAKKKGYAP